MSSTTERTDVRALVVLSLAHACDDVNQSFLPALLPFLVAERGYTYAAASALIFAGSLSSSVVQPAIGHLADRRAMPLLIAFGVFAAGLGVALIGIAPDYRTMLLAAFASGLGVAAFHPEAGRYANYVSGARKATAMRWFAAGGNAGFAAGPAFAAAAIGAFGLPGTLLAAVPVALSAGAVALEVPRLEAARLRAQPAARGGGADDWRGFGILSCFVVLRSMTFFGLLTFLPLYCVAVLHATPGMAAAVLSLLLVGGIGGTLASGPAADRFGRKPLLAASAAATALAVPAFLWATQLVPSLALAWIASPLIGFAIVGSQTAFIVLGQEMLPRRIGFASGVTLGLAVSLGGLAAPFLGMLADRRGPGAALAVTALIGALAFAVALAVPEVRRERRSMARAAKR